MKSGHLYSLVTKYWPRIAAGLVVVIGLVEFVVGLTADSSFELYLTVFAATTGSLWFLFERAEQTLSTESREKVVELIASTDYRDTIESIPDQFALLFDEVFGRRTLSIDRLGRTTLASLVSVAVVLVAWLLFGLPSSQQGWEFIGPPGAELRTPDDLDGRFAINFFWPNLRPWAWAAELGVVVFAVSLNFIFDFLSVWETRLVIGWTSTKRKALLPLLVTDFVFTALISAVCILGGWQMAYGGLTAAIPPGTRWTEPAALVEVSKRFEELATLQPALGSRRSGITIPPVVEWRGARGGPVAVQDRIGDWYWIAVFSSPQLVGPLVRGSDDWPDAIFPNYVEQAPVAPLSVERLDKLVVVRPSWDVPIGIFFYSAFFSSVWLWVYVLSIPVSRILLRMNSGVGFLLRVTDVEKQPFRSMGFVSVIIVSGLFALGLPLVLL